MISIVQRYAVLPIIELLRGEPISRCLRELRTTQWYSSERLKELQWSKLKALLGHCYENVPFYREQWSKLGFHPDGLKTFGELAQLPVLTKDDLRFSSQALRAKNFTGRVEHVHSGGTLGIPVNLVRDMRSAAFIRASEARGLEWYGIPRGAKQFRVWGVPLDPSSARKERLKDRALNRIRMSTLDISPETVGWFFKAARGFRPRYVFSHTSALYKICQVMRDLGLDGKQLHIGHVVCTGDTVHEGMRSRIEETFGCRVINEYGCSEMGPIAFECPAGNMHLTMENILAEFADHESSADCSEILLTNLNSYSMPLVRYRVGDTGKLLGSECSCGRHSDLMSFDAGRILSMLVAADGHFVSGSVFCYIAFDIIQKHKGIKDFRVVQKTRDQLEITLVKDSTFSEGLLALFTSRIREKLGSEMRIDYVFKAEIPPEKSGKRLFVRSELRELLSSTSREPRPH
jgi:phenylacetate-CoA ligase